MKREESSHFTPSQSVTIGAEEISDFKKYLAVLDTLIKSGADPQIVYDFIVIHKLGKPKTEK